MIASKRLVSSTTAALSELGEASSRVPVKFRSFLVALLALGVAGFAAHTPSQAQRARPAAQAGQSYSFAFVNADLAQVADEVLGRTLGLSYTIDAGVSAKVTFRLQRRLTRAELLEAFEDVLASSDLVLSPQGEGLVISAGKAKGGSPGRSISRGRSSEVVPVQLANAAPSAVAKALEAVGSGGLVVLSDDRSGLLLLSGTPKEIEAAQAVVRSIERGNQENSRSRWVDLKFANASVVAGELNEILAAIGQGGTEATAVPRLNGLVIAGRSEAGLNEAVRWIAKLDVGSKDDGAALWVYRPRHVSAEALNVTLNALFHEAPAASEGPAMSNPSAGRSASQTLPQSPIQGTRPFGQMTTPATETTVAGSGPSTRSANAEGVKVAVDREGNALVIFAPPAQRAQLQKLLEEIDRPLRQVLIEASILEVSLSDEFRLGVDWSLLTSGGRTQIIQSNGKTGAISPTFPGIAVTYLGTDARAAIDALGARTSVQVVSAPKIMALDNRTAHLQIGDQVPVAVQTAQSATTVGAPTLVSIEYRNTGVLLDVTPRVTGHDTITLVVAQEVSSVAKTSTSGIDSPTIQQRRFDSALLVKSGETIALGGLISSSNSKGGSGIPGLSAIPVIGGLFGASSSDKRRTELIVLLTARILPDSASAAAATGALSAQMPGIESHGLIPR